MNSKDTNAGPAEAGRVIGLDLHPDVFSAAALSGRDAGTARVVQNWDRWATKDLVRWAGKLPAGDVVVLEATGNAFTAAEQLRACGVTCVVLETQTAGQVRSSYCTNDRTDAVKLARIYLSGLAKNVWQPDEKTRERREVLHRYLRAVCDATRARHRLTSFLSDRGVRLPKGTRLTAESGRTRVLGSAAWSVCQQMLLRQMLEELRGADERRRELSACMAREVSDDPALWRLLRLLGVRHIIAFAIGAVVGDIARFANPKKLVAYLGLTPRQEISGTMTRGPVMLPNYGRRDLRSLLIQAAHVALRRPDHPLHAWAWKLCLRKSHKNVAVAAVARKLTVSIWYCLRGLLPSLQEVGATLELKIGRIATVLGAKTITLLGYESRSAFIKHKSELLLRPA